MRVEASNGSDPFAQFKFTDQYIPREKGSVLKISFKADDFANITGNTETLGRILYGFTGLGSTKGQQISFLGIKNSHLYVYADGTDANIVDLGELNNDWMDIAFVFDWEKKEDFYYTLYYGDNYSQKVSVSIPYKITGDIGLSELRLGLPSVTGEENIENRIGTSYCVDDFQLYQKTKEILSDEEVNAIGSGILVDTTKEKTVDIQSSTGKSTVQLLEEALAMKVGVDYALFKNVKQPIFLNEETNEAFGAPVVIDGHVMVPLELILDYIDFPYYVHEDNLSYDITTGTSKTNLVAGRDSASVNGERKVLTAAPGFVKTGNKQHIVIALDDVETLFPGWLVTYDDMGLIIIYEDLTPEDTSDNTEIVNRDENLATMVNLMKKFIYDTVTVDENGNALRETESYIATGKAVYEDVKANTNNFQHPYIGANQSVFDKLNAVYNAKSGDADYNPVAKGFLDTLIKSTNAFYKNTAELNEDGSYKGIKEDKIPVNVYKDGVNPSEDNPNAIPDTTDGYDPAGGRMEGIGGYADNLLDLAFAYQVTRDMKYVELAYDWALALGAWEHWGPGHFLTCASSTAAFGMAFDWLYNIMLETYGQDAVDSLAKIIYDMGVHDGYRSSAGLSCEHPRNLGDGSRYTTAASNWNAVCSSGMIIGSLAIMQYDSMKGADNMVYERDYLVGNNIINLGKNGLDMYAPDGSYIESASYWAYGTNAFFKLVMALESAAGTDYGFMDTCGMDTTCYYACQIESSDGKLWNYHDGGADGFTSGNIGRQDTHMFNFVAYVTGDSALASLRYQHLTGTTNVKNVTIYDMLYYPFDGIEEVEELPLDYHMDGIDAFVSRSDWGAGAMYTGLMGGANNANHGQIDSGNFIYHNKGIIWFMDLGSEQYNAYGYFGSSRNNYYRSNAEGQNVVCLLSDPENVKFGQFSQAGGDMIMTYVNEHGSYAIIDNTSVYAGNVVAANRGILVTNDRNTVVIQDEINFGIKVQDVVWIAHTAQEIEIDETGKIAYLSATDKNGKTYTLRATIVSPSKAYKFSVRSADDLLLEATFGPNDSAALGGVPEYTRSGLKRLVIDCRQAVRFNVAVVMEMIDDKNTAAPTSYTWTELSTWEPSAQDNSVEDNVTNAEKRKDAKETDIRTVTNKAMSYFEAKTAFTTQLEEFYSALTTVEYTLNAFPVFDSGLEDDYDDYLDLNDAYEAFRESANVAIESVYQFSFKFLGLTEEDAAAEEEEETEDTGDEETEEGAEEGGDEGSEE